MASIPPTHSTPSTGLAPPLRRTANPDSGLGDRVREEGRHAPLDEILLTVVVNALGPDARITVAREDWLRVEEAIRGPVSVAATAALERLAADLETTLCLYVPELVRRIGDQRLRTEFGYD